MPQANALFVIFALSDSEAVALRMALVSPWLTLALKEGQWLLIAPSATTTKEVADKIGISEGETGSGIVVRVENYFGRYAASTWEWISAKIGAPLGTTTAV